MKTETCAYAARGLLHIKRAFSETELTRLSSVWTARDGCAPPTRRCVFRLSPRGSYNSRPGCAISRPPLGTSPTPNVTYSTSSSAS